jgi:phage-related baseplate assembly protein
MVARFLAPDLTQLSPAALIEEIDAEVILAAQKAFVLARWEEVRQTRPDLPALDTLGLETEPMTILLEAFAYRETLLRALVNDKARAVLLAYATGSDLDHLGALFATYRMVVVPASDGVEAVMETLMARLEGSRVRPFSRRHVHR